MSDFENITGTTEQCRLSSQQRHLRVVESRQTAEPEQPQNVPSPSALPPSVPSQTQRERVALSFDRFRRTSPQIAPLETATRLPALPALYVPPVEEETCPNCKGLGFLRREVPVGHPAFGKPEVCACRVKQRASLFGSACIPETFQGRSFESYLQQPLEMEQEMIAIRVMQFMTERLSGGYEGEKRGLYLYGSWGVGKSGLAIAALQQAISEGHCGLYLSTSALLDMLREAIAASQRLARGYGDEEDKQEESAGAKVLRIVEEVEWLVLDDLGVECGTEFVVNRLYRIIEGRRLRKRLYTIFTSNKDAGGLEQRWRPAKGGVGAFDDCYRVIERLGEYCVVIPVGGRNLRQKEGKAW